MYIQYDVIRETQDVYSFSKDTSAVIFMGVHDFCSNTNFHRFLFPWNVVVLFALQQEIAKYGD